MSQSLQTENRSDVSNYLTTHTRQVQLSRKLFGHRPADRRAGSEITQRVATRPFPFGHMLEDPPLFAV